MKLLILVLALSSVSWAESTKKDKTTLDEEVRAQGPETDTFPENGPQNRALASEGPEPIQITIHVNEMTGTFR